MAARPNFFLILSEMTVLLLGGLLILLALTRTVGVPSSHAVMFILGAILIYWALRAWMPTWADVSGETARSKPGRIAWMNAL